MQWSRKHISLFTFFGDWEDLARLRSTRILSKLCNSTVESILMRCISARDSICFALDHMNLQRGLKSGEHSSVHQMLVTLFHPVHPHSDIHPEGWKKHPMSCHTGHAIFSLIPYGRRYRNFKGWISRQEQLLLHSKQITSFTSYSWRCCHVLLTQALMVIPLSHFNILYKKHVSQQSWTILLFFPCCCIYCWIYIYCIGHRTDKSTGQKQMVWPSISVPNIMSNDVYR